MPTATTAAVRPFATLAEASKADQATVLARLATGGDGLDWEEAHRRLQAFGSNELASQKPPSWPVVLWAALKHPFNGVLAALAVVSYLTDDIKAVVVMGTMIVLSVGLRFWQEMKSLVQAESLRRMVRAESTVRRLGPNPARKPSLLDPLASEVATHDLVPGDIVLLSAGDMVPADMRLLESRDLFVTQSALTGEAMPVEKYDPDRGNRTAPRAEAERLPADVLDSPHMLFMGTSIVSGSGRAIVVATGNRTFFGSMAEKLM